MRCLLIICLFVLAGHSVESAPKEFELPSGDECLPGSSWQSQCNNCVCTDKGIAACTLTLCLDEHNNEPQKTCAPKTSWRNECNTCWCSTSGHALCTLVECYGFVPRS